VTRADVSAALSTPKEPSEGHCGTSIAFCVAVRMETVTFVPAKA
jgi:hypothetical protein